MRHMRVMLEFKPDEGHEMRDLERAVHCKYAWDALDEIAELLTDGDLTAEEKCEHIRTRTRRAMLQITSI